MTTTYEVTLKITITHPEINPLIDSNSVKCAINAGVEEIAKSNFQVYRIRNGEISGGSPDRVQVNVDRLKENGKRLKENDGKRFWQFRPCSRQ